MTFAALLAALIAAPGQAQDTDFQQGVQYRIEATLDDAADVLRGRAELTYTNNSADRLDTIFVHQHLNAFRPNSAWARRDLRFGERRFQDLGAEEHAFERFSEVRVDGQAVQPVYPGAPDSTVAAIPLPAPLGPGETVIVRMDWSARPSTTPRRQGRRDRHFDFAQWYPRIAVYNEDGWQEHPLLPQGEFFGEFATYDVTLDVASDQVIGATGVPVEGEPGWSGAAARGAATIQYGRDAYDVGPAESLGFLSAQPEAGRKRVRWFARDVHHFAWSTSPDYIYEGGQWEDVLIHVLYQPGDSTWDDGVAVDRTANALAWFDTIFGDYAYPQATNVHRIEDGGTEFPMLIMDGRASQGLIVHEIGHIYAHGILANNEWRQGWLDEGLVSFLDTWYAEAHGEDDPWSRTVEGVAELDRRGATRPVDTESALFRDYASYGAMTYAKASIVFRMLREYLGEETMRRVLRTYYDRYRFRHVQGEDLQRVAEEVSGEDLEWFFNQWIETSETLDYGIGDIDIRRSGNRWITEVEVLRLGRAWMPVTLEVGNKTVRLDSRERSQTVEVTTTARPNRAELDPGHVLLDVDRSNNAQAI